MPALQKLLLTAVLMAASGTESAFAVVNCTPLGYGSYVTKAGETCGTLVSNKKLNFKDKMQVAAINGKLNSFSCNSLKAGVTVCHPLKKNSEFSHERDRFVLDLRNNKHV